jgi:starch synthase
MPNHSAHPRILFVTPEVAFMPERRGRSTYCMGADSACFGEYLAKLIYDLLNMGVDVHVAQPDYRKLFEILSHNEQANPSIKLPTDRVHLAEDRAFFYSKPINFNYEWENITISLNFQREVINQIAPRVQPDLIHCHDWMTGLIPAAAKEYGISCLFTIRSSDSAKSLLSDVENRGIDAAAFWRHLFYDRFPGDYEDTRDTNPLDLLLSGILAAQQVETVNLPLLANTAKCRSKNFYACLRHVLAGKFDAGCVCGMAESPIPPANAASDKKSCSNNIPNAYHAGKQKNEPHTGQTTPWFNHRETAYRYMDLYEKILQRPLVTPQRSEAGAVNKNGLTKTSDSQAASYQKAPFTDSHISYNEQSPTQAMAPI